MKRIITGLGIGGLLALVVGLVLPHIPDSAFRIYSTPVHHRVFVLGNRSFQGSAAFCIQAVRFPGDLRATQALINQFRSTLASCATASDVMNLSAWLVVLGALALVIAVAVLILGRTRQRLALTAHAV